ncbi:MAG: hypothetical protein SWK76_05680 [Actinomycetota bacterium]|nr:hypothetical protein [Actinomycetota bacterium]
MDRRRFRFGALLLIALLMAAVVVAAPGCFGGEKSVDEVWQESEEAEKIITSLSMELSIYYQNTDIGSGLIQSTTIDISGDNVHSQSALFGQSFSEVIRVDSKQYSRYLGGEEWTEEQVTLTPESTTSQLAEFSELPSRSSSQENLGVEMVNGVEAYHLAFTLSPQEVSQLFANVPSTQLDSNAGGTVDVWIDQETFYKVKYEAVINNAFIAEAVGYGDVRIVNNISNMNQPVSITPPM